jgi:hypothetical protein
MTIIKAADYPRQQHAQAVRDGISKALASDKLVELVGEFHFGDDAEFPRETIVVPGGLTIRGTTGTKISGGGANTQTQAWGQPLAMDGGAFKVSTGAEHGKQHVAIRQIAFSGWKGAAILVDACNGLTVENCHFSQPSAGVIEGFNTADGTPIQNVNAVFVIGADCRGKFEARENECNLSSYETGSAPADDEQFLTCFGTNFEHVLIDGNSSVGNDDGIEVLFNNLHGDVRPQVQIQISNNVLNLTHQPRTTGSAGIVCCRSDGAKVDIVDNVVNTTGTLGAGILLTGDYRQGDVRKMTIMRNRIDQSADAASPHFAGIMMGHDLPFVAFPGSYALEKLGASLSGAMIKDNHLSGTVSFGYLTLDGGELQLPQCPDAKCEPNHSNHIVIEDYGPISGQYKLYLSCGTHDIEVRGNFEPFFICKPERHKVMTSEAVVAPAQPQPTPA